MTVECTQAQEIISAAYDGEERDPLALETAKDHCRSCAECAAYVRTLAAIHRLPAPDMPQPALERVLEALRAEREAAPAEVAVAGTETVAEPAPRRSWRPPSSRPHTRVRRACAVRPPGLRGRQRQPCFWWSQESPRHRVFATCCSHRARVGWSARRSPRTRSASTARMRRGRQRSLHLPKTRRPPPPVGLHTCSSARRSTLWSGRSTR
jgi:hypothetical protein